MRVIKRDGREVPYDRVQIASAVLKAMASTGEGNSADAERIAENVEHELLKTGVCAVEGIQDIVETVLMQNGYYSTAKAYCLYREKRSFVREANSRLMKGIDEIIKADARKSNVKRENANIDGNTPMGAMLQIGSLCARAYNEHYLLRPEHAKAYREGRYHIHKSNCGLVA